MSININWLIICFYFSGKSWQADENGQLYRTDYLVTDHLAGKIIVFDSVSAFQLAEQMLAWFWVCDHRRACCGLLVVHIEQILWEVMSQFVLCLLLYNMNISWLVWRIEMVAHLAVLCFFAAGVCNRIPSPALTMFCILVSVCSTLGQ